MAKLPNFLHLRCRDERALLGIFILLVFVVGTSGCASHRPAHLQLEPPSHVPALRDAEAAWNIRLLSYNIWGLPGWMTGARSGRYPQIARELDRLNPDIILLQEAWTAKARKSAPATDSWWRARAAGQHTFFQQSGLMTLSKFPIMGGEFYPFSRAAFPDRLVSKGVLKTTICLPDGSILNVWNVHLQEGGPAAVRRSQVQELVSRVQAAEDGQIADLVGGDFNCTPESPFFQELQQALGPTVYELGGGKPFVTWNNLSAKPGAGQTLDYMFVREHQVLQSVEAFARVAFAGPSPAQQLSDHLGLEAVVRFSPAVGPACLDGPIFQPAPIRVVATRPSSYPTRNVRATNIRTGKREAREAWGFAAGVPVGPR
ncbi:MAG TPA: endonuclease/exonuclease/phosphatase family protein [Candidatus Acidoferrum sp.]|nr:endonuclease/exonuclease/phosphatase family protein [Candidatus Acidoferrum sp.]